MATHGPFVTGSVEPVVLTFEANDLPIDLDLYGAITPILTNGAGAEVASPGTCVKVSPQTGSNKGKATYTPHSTSYTRSAGTSVGAAEKFGIRCSVLDATNVAQFFPGGPRDTILVYAR
jgi:hypothetical protein